MTHISEWAAGLSVHLRLEAEEYAGALTTLAAGHTVIGDFVEAEHLQEVERLKAELKEGVERIGRRTASRVDALKQMIQAAEDERDLDLRYLDHAYNAACERSQQAAASICRQLSEMRVILTAGAAKALAGLAPAPHAGEKAPSFAVSIKPDPAAEASADEAATRALAEVDPAALGPPRDLREAEREVEIGSTFA